MSEYQDALQQLKNMHQLIREKNLSAYTVTINMRKTMKSDDYNEMMRNFDFMESEGWITKRILSKDITEYRPTSCGIKTLEGL